MSGYSLVLSGLVIFGTGAFLTTYLPFSPMTIDIVNLTRSAQLRIFHWRRTIWAAGAVAFLIVAAAALSGVVGLEWLWGVSAISALLLFMYWSGYVPWVMSAPATREVVDAAAGDRILGPDDAVLGLFHGGEARAYPRDLIARPHFMPDEVGGSSVTVSYCILCNSGTAFVSEISGQPLSLDCVTAFNNNIIYRDVPSGNIIQQLDAEIIEGPDAGLRLDTLPLTVTTWGEWRKLHPGTQMVFAPPTTVRDKMVAWMLSVLIPIRKLSRRDKPWHRVRGNIDERLPAMAYVYGVEFGNERRAYPETLLEQQPCYNDVVGGKAIVVFYSTTATSGHVFERSVDGNLLEFSAGHDERFGDVFADRQTGTIWNLAGEAVEGKMQGSALVPAPHFNKLFWFAWSLFKPGTTVAGPP